jgi:hypothetical protein
MDHSLSLSTTSMRSPLAPAAESDSKATPEARLASPITLITWGRGEALALPMVSPRPIPIDVPAWPVWKWS